MPIEQIEGQEPEQTGPAPDAGQTFDADYVAKLRQEAANYRTQLKDYKTQVAELSPLAQKAKELEEAQKTEAEKLAEKIATMQNELEAQKQAAAVAQKTSALTVLAVQAGVPAEVVPLLDVSKFDLENTEATLEALKALAPAQSARGGNPSNPARGNGQTTTLTPAEWYAQRKSGSTSLFGG